MRSLRPRGFLSLPSLAAAALLAGASQGLLGNCGLFTDVAGDAFCPFVLEILTLGITTGTTPTTYDPTSGVTRLQMAAFLSRTVDGVLKRGSRRAALGQFWTPQNDSVLAVTTLSNIVGFPISDGTDVWVPGGNGGVSRVRASDGSIVGVWTGPPSGTVALSAIGKIFVTGAVSPGQLSAIDPREAPGGGTTVASNLGNLPNQLAFDGARIWTANGGAPGSVSIVTPGATIPWTVTTVTAGFSGPRGALFDGSNVWITDRNTGTLLKLDSTGAVLQTVTVGFQPYFPAFDGSNIWVPNLTSASVSVIRASTGATLATLTGNALNGPTQAAFDGERILVTNDANSVSLWKAADLSVIGNFFVSALNLPKGVCSDGISFWITLRNDQLGRF